MTRQSSGRSHVRGFTLLEAIVTLVIVSLIVTVLMQALGQTLGMRTRLLRHQREARVMALQEQWFRDTVGSAVADLPDALGYMQGGRGSLELVTAAPLESRGVQRIGWVLKRTDGGQSLHYTGVGLKNIEVIAGPLRNAAFAYMDHEGRWQAEWRPDPDSPLALPRMVRFEADTTAGSLLWLVPIVADPAPRELLKLEEVTGGP